MISTVFLMNLMMATTTTGISIYMVKKGIDKMMNQEQPITTITFEEFNKR